MKKTFFLRLAFSGIAKNRKVYIPYILSCTGAVMMQFIMQSLSCSDVVTGIHGGSNIRTFFSLGRFVIAVFSLIFLLYTNSFLIRYRKREFGLYNVLGVGKKGLYWLMFLENTVIALISTVSGIVFGLAFSKLTELGLIYCVKAEVDYSFKVSVVSIFYTAAVFAVIFTVLLIKSLLSVRRTEAVSLLRSASYGEKPPKANAFISAFGVILLTVSYVIAVTTETPLAAFLLFAADVILVIIATYLLFISGSVTLCRTLQKNDSYYYNKRRYVSLASMKFRMKRNGAGLASICILSTMVLVMLSSSASLYFGAETSIGKKFPQENYIAVYLDGIENVNEKTTSEIDRTFGSVFREKGISPSNTIRFCYVEFSGLQNLDLAKSVFDEHLMSVGFDARLRNYVFITEEEYRALTGIDPGLAENEALLKTLRCDYDFDRFRFGDLVLDVTGTADGFPEIGSVNTNVFPSMLFVVKDTEVLLTLTDTVSGEGEKALSVVCYYGYDTGTDRETASDILHRQTDLIPQLSFCKESPESHDFFSGCKEEERSDFYSTFGGLFFLGITLSLLFIFAAAMIIYYKQISEGYEDAERFIIMQKIGMTKKEIRKSINSQILTVFFTPLLFAGLHLIFAMFPIIKILQMFNIYELKQIILTSVISFILFGLIYGVIYRLTASAYFRIVSDREKGTVRSLQENCF